MSTPIRIVIADDHTLVRQSVARLLGSSGMKVVGQAGTAEEAVEMARIHAPDVVVMDVSMPGEQDGMDAAAAIRSDGDDVKVVMLTMHDDDTTLRRATEAAVDGYVAKTATTDEVVQAVRTVADGGAYVSPAVAMRMMRLAAGGVAGSNLTEREVEILRILARGARIQDIATELFLSPKTVKNHLTSVYAKLHVETAAQAVAEAYRTGIVTTG